VHGGRDQQDFVDFLLFQELFGVERIFVCIFRLSFQPKSVCGMPIWVRMAAMSSAGVVLPSSNHSISPPLAEYARLCLLYIIARHTAPGRLRR
jgi:hypothetical protein